MYIYQYLTFMRVLHMLLSPNFRSEATLQLTLSVCSSVFTHVHTPPLPSHPLASPTLPSPPQPSPTLPAPLTPNVSL